MPKKSLHRRLRGSFLLALCIAVSNTQAACSGRLRVRHEAPSLGPAEIIVDGKSKGRYDPGDRKRIRLPKGRHDLEIRFTKSPEHQQTMRFWLETTARLTLLDPR